MSDICLMDPVGDEYSSVHDGFFALMSALNPVVETSIDVFAFWKFNVKVVHYKHELKYAGDVTVTESTSTATSAIKDGLALFYTNIHFANLDRYALQPALYSPHADSYTPNEFAFYTFIFFKERSKWYILAPNIPPDGILTADLSKIVIDRNFSDPDYGERYTYTCLEPFY